MQLKLQILNSCQQRKSNSYTHIVCVHQHHETNVDAVRRHGNWLIEVGRRLPEVHMQFPISQLVYNIAQRTAPTDGTNK